MGQLTDVINLVLNINGNAAQNQLNELRKKSADLTLSMKGLKKGTQEYITASTDLKKVNTDIDDLKKSIGLASLSFKELTSEKRKFTALRDSQTPLSKEYKDYDQQLQKVILRQRELSNSTQSLGKVQSTFSSMGSSIKLLAASYIGFFAITNAVKSLIQGTIKLSDQLGDLRRVAGLTKDEANNLYKSLLQIDTRTSGAGLLSIAIIAGKLGVAKEDIASFTMAVDKLVITLGDELGNADQITTQLGKILNVFDGKVTGENISYLGNAIVDLANKGVATGGFIVDFTQRVSGIAKASNLSLASTLGLAAGFESLGLRSESSATALQKLLTTIGTDVPKAAKIAGVPVKEFNQLFAENPQEALIKYAEGLVKNKRSFSEITSSFKDAGEEGARVVQTLQAIAQQGDYLRKQIDISNKSIKEQNALNDGAAIKQENLAGSIEKLGKAWDRIIANNRITSFFSGIINVLSGALDAVNLLSDSFDSLDEKRKKGNAKADKAQIDFAKRIVDGTPASKNDPGFMGMSQKTVEEQQKLAESYKQIYISSRKELAAFLDSSDKDNLLRRQRLINQVAQDGRIFVATQKQIQSLNKDAKTPGTSKGGEGSTKNAAPEKNDYDSVLKEAQSFYKKLQELKFGAEQASKSQDQKEIDAVKHKYEEIFVQYDALQKKLSKQDLGLLGPRGDISASEEKELAALVAKQKQAAFEKDQQQIKENLTKEYDAKKQEETLFYAGQKEIQGKRFADGEIDYKNYQANLAAIDVKSNAALLENAQDFAKLKVTINGKVVTAVEEAEKDMTAFEKAEFEKRIANQLRAEQAKQAELKLLRDLDNQADLSKANTKVIIADTAGDAKGLADAQKKLLALQRKQKNEALDAEAADAKRKITETGAERARLEKKIDDDLKAQKDESDADYNQAVQDADNALFQKRVQMAQAYAETALSIFSSLNSALNNIEDRKLQKIIARNNKEKTELQKQFNHKLISQAQYDKKVAALDADADKEKQKIAIQQAKRQKALDIFSAISGTASAVVGALGSKPWGPWNIALAALVGALGAVQIGVISNEPLPAAPAMGEGGLIKKGPYHSDKSKGLPLINPETGETELLLEKDEAVVKGAAVRDQNTYTVTGTPSQIASELNSMHGGVDWHTGAVISTPKLIEEEDESKSIFPAMGEGGLIKNIHYHTPPQIASKVNGMHGGVNWHTGAVISMPKFRERPMQIRTDMPQILGKSYVGLPGKGSEQINEFYKMSGHFERIANSNDQIIEEIKNQKNRLHAVVSINEIRDTERKYNIAKKASGLG